MINSVEDYQTIASRMKQIEAYKYKRCFVKEHIGLVIDCWCWKAKDDGQHIPCTESISE